ncbi:MAG: site-2 protease family protein [Planctomycetota bacterium]
MKDRFSSSYTISSLSVSASGPNRGVEKDSDLEAVRRGTEISQPPRSAGVDLQQRLDRIYAAQYIAYKRSQLRRSAILFLLTFLSTFLVGSNYMPLEYVLMKLSPGYEKYLVETVGAENLKLVLADAFAKGYHYAVPLMLILFCHEMGHYLQSVRYRVPASLPYFIPLPLPPMGTMGAVIFQGRGAATRKQMFDIAVSGPLAGLLITIPVLWYGIQSSGYGPRPPGAGLEFGEPLLVKWMMSALHGDAPEGQIFLLNNIGFAGWVGVLITAMNLLPVGQLDGGHILYTLIGKPAHYVAYGVIGLAFAYMSLQQDFSFTLLLFLLLMTGPKHPPTANDAESIGVLRHLIGWATLGFLVIGFTPTPIITPEPGVQHPEQKELPTPEFANRSDFATGKA